MTGSRWVCVSHADSGDLWLLSMAQDGALQPQQRLSLGGQLMPMAQSPCGARLYVARRSDPMAVISLALDRQAQRLTVLGEAALPASMAFIAASRAAPLTLSTGTSFLPPRNRKSSLPISSMKREGSQPMKSRPCLRRSA